MIFDPKPSRGIKKNFKREELIFESVFGSRTLILRLQKKRAVKMGANAPLLTISPHGDNILCSPFLLRCDAKECAPRIRALRRRKG